MKPIPNAHPAAIYAEAQTQRDAELKKAAVAVVLDYIRSRDRYNKETASAQFAADEVTGKLTAFQAGDWSAFQRDRDRDMDAPF